MGFYISSHPLKPYARDLKNFARPLSAIEEQHNGAPLRVGGLIEEVRKLFDRNGKPFAFVTLKDLNDTGDIAFFAEAFTNHQQLLVEGETILVEGRVCERNGRLSVQADRALPLKSARAELTQSVTLSLSYQNVGDPPAQSAARPLRAPYRRLRVVDPSSKTAMSRTRWCVQRRFASIPATICYAALRN